MFDYSFYCFFAFYCRNQKIMTRVFFSSIYYFCENMWLCHGGSVVRLIANCLTLGKKVDNCWGVLWFWVSCDRWIFARESELISYGRSRFADRISRTCIRSTTMIWCFSSGLFGRDDGKIGGIRALGFCVNSTWTLYIYFFCHLVREVRCITRHEEQIR